MSVRYVSFDIHKGDDHDALRAFLKQHHGKAVTESLYRVETDMDLETFRAELGEAAEGDDSVTIIIRTKDGIRHGRAHAR